MSIVHSGFSFMYSFNSLLLSTHYNNMMNNRNCTYLRLLCARHCVRYCLTIVPKAPWVPAQGKRLDGGGAWPLTQEKAGLPGRGKAPGGPSSGKWRHRYHLLNSAENSCRRTPFHQPSLQCLSVPLSSLSYPPTTQAHTSFTKY